MLSDLNQIRAKSFHVIGTAIQRNVGLIIGRWEKRARDEQPSAERSHHAELIDHLPPFLSELGRTLSESGDDELSQQFKLAGIHGDQRWESGWSIAELVRDYQLLRLVLVSFLQEEIGRPLSGHEVMALGVAIDDAILISVTSFLSCFSEEAALPPPAEFPKDGVLPPADLLGIFAVLGHELRNSLAPLTNSLHILQIAGADPEVVEKTRCLMDRQVKVMSRLVDDLMDLPRVARGKVSLKTERIDLNRLIRECVEDRAAGFKDSGITLQLNLTATSVWTIGDVTRLRQAVGNLLSNAIKFTDAGGQVCVSLAPISALGRAELCIQDNGIGIDPLFLPRIFESFNQADRSMERSRGGLGIGLALVKGLIELHGGRVSVKSDGIGCGTAFTIELPIYDQLQTKIAHHDVSIAPVNACRRVLVIDDNLDLAESTRMILELNGHTVYLAHSGADGLAIARAMVPDVVVCDIGLPGMSGYDVCRELNSQPTLAGSLKIALSGHSSTANQEQALRAGFDVFLLKPFDPAQIAQVVARPESQRTPK